MTDREKSHEEALHDIHRMVSVDDPPAYAFACVQYPETVDYTHSAGRECQVVDVFEALAVHVLVVAEATRQPPAKVLEVLPEMVMSMEEV